MDSVINTLANHITELGKDIAPASNGTADVKRMANRSAAISAMSSLKTSLEEALSKLNEQLAVANAAQQAEISFMNDFLAKLGTTDEWETVKHKSSFKRKFRERQQELAKAQAAPPKSDYRLCKFTEALALSALPVATFTEVKQNGELYYVTTADHFAFRLAGQLFHGNIGTIYTDEKNPAKIKDCKFANECLKKGKCDYYHDPLMFPGFTDKRNFIASSWLYSPPGAQYKNKTRSRRFGSLEHLDIDIVDLQTEETRRFCDQTMHDVLCSLLLMKYTKNNEPCQSLCILTPR